MWRVKDRIGNWAREAELERAADALLARARASRDREAPAFTEAQMRAKRRHRAGRRRVREALLGDFADDVPGDVGNVGAHERAVETLEALARAARMIGMGIEAMRLLNFLADGETLERAARRAYERRRFPSRGAAEAEARRALARIRRAAEAMGADFGG
jgi:hypothetical protein